MNCPKCGVELPNDTNFCDKCGHQINDSVARAVTETGHLKISRKKSVYGFAVALTVTINNASYEMKSGDELNFDLQPGKYTITYKVWCRRLKEVSIDVTANGDYFIEFVNDYLWGGFKLSKKCKLN